jgi:hypothetical protein
MNLDDSKLSSILGSTEVYLVRSMLTCELTQNRSASIYRYYKKNEGVTMFKSYIDPVENKEAKAKLPKLMFEGLLMGGAGLGVLALIFEIAADAFSVAAYQTLLAIHGAQGYHQIAIAAFIVLSILLFLGIVPAYKAGAYLRPNAGGSGPLVEAIGPPKLRWLSWIGTSLFFLDAVLTIIISAISASDVTMLVLPELAPYRILLAEAFAFFIMVVLVALGPNDHEQG